MRTLAAQCTLWPLVLGAVALTSSADGQEKGTPTLPPINPAVARLEHAISGLDGPGFALAYHPARDILVAACDRGTVQVWQKDTLLGFRVGSGNRLAAHQGAVLRLAWGNGPVLASTGADRRIVFWDMAEGMERASARVDTRPRGLASAPDGKSVAAACEDGAVRVFDTATAKEIAAMSAGAEWLLCVAFSPDGARLAAGRNDGTIILWETGGKKLKDLPAPPMPAPKTPADPVPVTAIAFAPDAKTLFAGLADGNILAIDLGDGKVLRTLTGHGSAVTAVQFHPGGNVLLSASKDRTVRLWNPNAGALLKALEGHEAWVEDAVFILGGTRVASVSADQTVRIWDLTDPPKK